MIAIIEAMKMQNFPVERSGVVQRADVKVGSGVAAGDALFEVA